MDIESIQRTLGYQFNDTDYLVSALTHPSYCLENPKCKHHNQQLEFLGDAVISLILAERLLKDHPKEREGWLTKARSALVKGKALVSIADSMGIINWMRTGRSENFSQQRGLHSAMEDALEALAGAIFIDSDYETSRAIILAWFSDLIPRLDDTLNEDNPKGQLQERTQAKKPSGIPYYKIVKEDGPDHQKIFIAHVLLFDKIIGTGEGHSKKDAEEKAARNALENFSN